MKRKKKSDKNEEPVMTEQDVQAKDNESSAEAEETVAAEQTADKDAEIAEAKDKYLRLYSEFDNFRKRTARERLDLINSAGREIMEDLLPVLDDFERAIETSKDAKDVASVIEGVKLVQTKMINILQAKGLKAFESKEEAFDADFHEAITRIPAPDPKLSGKVVDVIETGYMLNDKVLRYAKVVVGE